ncbi:MAG: hypothetical protein GYA60_08700 [Candidatus Methanofastidiosa archaeon]|nr:hypothetical protein [Candidatus Methanofastidiosa archaeon]
MKEKFYEKYAWVIFLAIGLMTMAAAVPHALGLNTDPELVKSIVGMTIEDLKLTNPMSFELYNFYFRSGGLSDLGFAFLLIVISATAYRRGEKWAWYSFWIVPAFFLSFVALSLTLKTSSSLIPPLMVFIVLSLIGLLLPFRKFFPKKA